MTFITETVDQSTILKVEGVLSIYEAEAFKKELLEGLDKSSELVIDLGAVSECDLTCIQLLYSAKKTALEKGKIFAIMNISGPVKKIIEKAALPLEKLPVQDFMEA